jgi:glycosyltransferase involved in cell wall biosynthesis
VTFKNMLCGKRRFDAAFTPKAQMCDMQNTFTAPSSDFEERDAVSGNCSSPKLRARRLKICFISETVHAGVGRHVVDVALELSRRGHQIHLLYSPIRCDPQFLADLESEPNVHCKPVPMPRPIGMRDVHAFAAIRNHVRQEGPFDIVHGHSSKGGGYARLLKPFTSSRICYSPHAFATLSPVAPVAKRLIYRTLEWGLAPLTDRIICTSQGELEHGRALGIGRQRLALIPNGGAAIAAPGRDKLRAELGFSPGQIVIGFAGRMEDQKAPERLIAVARKLLPELPVLTLLMIGDGPKRAPLEALLERAGLSSRVRWLGAVNARAWMPAMDSFVLPSLYEGFAYVLIEALYAGLPIICTPVGGAHESVVPGVNGFIVPHDSPAAMAGAIRTIATDDGLRRKMAEASRLRAELFSIPRMADSLERLYLRLTAPARPTDTISASAEPA